MDRNVTKARAFGRWLAGPEAWTRGKLVGDLAVAVVFALIGAGLDLVARTSTALTVVAAVACVALVLLRRRLPATTLLVAAALGGLVTGPVLVMILLGWSAGRRITDVGRAVGTFSLALLLTLGASLWSGHAEMAPVVVLVFSALMFLATTVVPGLASRYWYQRRTLLDTLRERNAQLLRERAMVAGQARLRERQRIAQDMHDSLGHQLALISVHTGALEVDRELTDRQREAVGVLRQASVAAMHELREVVGILRDGVRAPEEHEAVGAPGRGVAGLGAVVDSARAAGTEVSLVTSGTTRPLAPSIDHAAYRIVQEGLTNAYKHAPGARIEVGLRYEDDSLVVEVANGPAGAVPGVGAEVSGGQGLTGLRERARLVGGMVHAGPLEDGGFRVAGVLPYGAGPAGVEDELGYEGLPGAAGAPGFAAGAPAGWGAGPSGAAVDWALAGERKRGRTQSVALGCGVAVAALALMVIVLVVGAVLFVGSMGDAYLSRADYDAVRVGSSESEVRAGLPRGENLLTSGMDRKGPPRPAGSTCLALLGEDNGGDELTETTVYRFCFRDGRLVEKITYRAKQ
ncbi:sensor histidine kinase [Streptomyces sp. BI20]|uniref:sensor histidine kinase n=1 Tax=Streptomyces sp. BI20 TaxID=3403460 RepID=UPI003C730002